MSGNKSSTPTRKPKMKPWDSTLYIMECVATAYYMDCSGCEMRNDEGQFVGHQEQCPAGLVIRAKAWLSDHKAGQVTP